MNTSGTEHLAGNSNTDGLNINPESFYYSLKFVNSAIESANEFNNSINSKSIDSSLVAKLGYSFDAIKTCAKEALNTLNELSTRMGNTKDVLSRISSTNSSIFESIDAQINLNNLVQFGDLESETDQQLYWNYMADIYRGAQAKLSQNGVLSRASNLMNLNEIELFAINQMKEKSNLDLYEKYLKYRDMESQVTDLETEIRKLETERVAAVNEGMQGAERRKALEAEIEELQKQRYDIKRKLRDVAPELKESGYLEYTGWEQVCNSFKQMGDNWGEVFSNLYEGDFSEAWESTKVAFKSTGATFCVINEKLLAGGAKVLEYLNDGTVMLKTAINSPFLIAGDAIFGTDTLDQAWDNTMAYVAEDMVGDVEKVFYENTKVGQIINDNSLLKYDSAGANLFKNAGVKLTETAVCVVIGAFTAGAGGYAAAAGFGFLEGFGEGGERQFNIVDEDGNYTNRNLKGVALATLNGGAKAVQSVGYAKMGRGLASAFGNQPVGANEMSKFATKLDTALAKSPKVARVAVKTLVNGDTAIELAGAGCRYAATGIETGDWKAGIGEFALDAGLVLVGNYATQWKLDSKLRLADINKPPAMPEFDPNEPLAPGTYINDKGEIIRSGAPAPIVTIPENPGDIVVINPLDEIDDEIAKAMDLGDYDTVRKLQSQKSALFQEEMASVFGAENVEQVSGISIEGANGRFIDPNAAADNINLMKTKAYDICLKEGLIAENENCTRDLFAKYSEVYFNPQEYNSTTHQFIWPGGEGAAQYTRDNLVAKARELGIKDVDKLTDDEILLTIGRDYGFDELEKMGAKSVPISSLDGKSFDRINDTVGVGNDKYGEFFGNTEDSLESRALKPKTAAAGVRHRYALSGTPTSDTFDAEFVYGQPKTEITLGENGDYQIICSQTTARPWFAQPGGAEQYTFYLADSSGKILTKVAYDGTTQLYKLNVTDLKNLGIILGETIQ